MQPLAALRNFCLKRRQFNVDRLGDGGLLCACRRRFFFTRRFPGGRRGFAVAGDGGGDLAPSLYGPLKALPRPLVLGVFAFAQIFQAVARLYALRLIGQHIVFCQRATEFVVSLDEQPVRLARPLPAVNPDKHPAAVQLFAIEIEFQLALSQSIVRIADGRPRAAIPNDDFAGSVLPFGNAALERGILDRMIFDLDSQSFFTRIERRALRHGPALQNAVQLQKL